MKLVLLGAPGAGKSTQAQILARRFNIARLTTSEILQDYLEDNKNDELREIMSAGGLVSDDIVLKLVEERLKRPGGYVFDGFPRNIAQAEALERMQGEMDAIFYVNTPDEIIIERISGRAVCSSCGRLYRATDEMLCGCGGSLARRPDDNPEAVANRLRVYHEQTAPVIDFYRERGQLTEIDGTVGIDEITAAIAKAVEVDDGHIG